MESREPRIARDSLQLETAITPAYVHASECRLVGPLEYIA